MRVRYKARLSILKALREEFWSDSIIFLLFFKSIAFRKQLFSIFFCNKRSDFLFFLYLIFSINIFIFSQKFSSNFCKL